MDLSHRSFGACYNKISLHPGLYFTYLEDFAAHPLRSCDKKLAYAYCYTSVSEIPGRGKPHWMASLDMYGLGA